MIDTNVIRNKVLDLAIQGKLVEQRAEEGTAETLYAEIQEEKQKLIAEGKIKKEKPLAEIKEDEKPFEIPKSWKWCKINEIAFVTKLAGFEYTSHIAPNLVTAGVPLFKGKNVQNGQLIYIFESFIPEKISDLLPRSQLNRKCLLTPYVGTIGNIAIFDGSIKAHLGSNVGKIEFFNENSVFVLEEYMLFAFRSPLGLKQLSKHKKATAQESISIGAIRDAILPLPPLAEQHRIVGVVSEIFKSLDIIDDLKSKYASDCEVLKSKLLDLAIRGKLVEQRAEEGTAETLYAEIQAEKQKLIAEGKIKKENPLAEIKDDEKPFEIPKSWKWVRLGECSTYAQTKIKISAKNIQSSMWSLDLADIEKESGRIINYCKANEREIIGDKVRFYKGQILYSKLRPYLKKILVAPADGICTSELVPFNVFGKIAPQFIAFVLRSPYVDFFINSVTYGIKMPRVSADTMTALLIPLPPLAEQHRIVARIEELLPLCDKLN